MAKAGSILHCKFITNRHGGGSHGANCDPQTIMMKSFKKTFAKTLTSVTAAAALVFYASGACAEESLRVGVEASFAPFEFIDEKTGDLNGFDIELIKAIGKAEGYSVELRSMQFDGLIPAILTGQLDAAISAFTITDERKKKVDFSEPYYKSGLGIMIRAADKDTIKGATDLKGKTLCAKIGTSGAAYAEKVEGAKVVQFNTTPETYMELRNGSCVAVINDRPVNAYYIATAAPGDLVSLPDYITAEDYGIVMPKGSEKMNKIISEGLAKIKADGTFQAISEKYFGKQ